MKIIRSRRKTIELEINRAAELVIRAPMATPLSTINRLIEDKKPWIERKIAAIKARAVSQPPKAIVEGEVFPYLGQAIKLTLVGDLNIDLQFDGGLRLNQDCIPFAKRLLLKWYRKEAEKYLFARARYLSEEYSFRYTELALSKAEKRWGSCSAKNAVRLNWRLIMAPAEVIDYVIIHELTHTKIKGHGKIFWQNISKMMPDYRTQSTWLKVNANKLYFKFASGQIPKIKA